MLNQLSRHLRVLTLGCGLAGLVASPALAGAQTPPASPPGSAAAAAARNQPQGPTLELTMDEAVDMALQNNLGLQQTRLNVDVADYSIAIARSSYLPQVLSSFNRSTSVRQPGDFTEGGNDVSNSSNTVSGQYGQLLPWYGGNFSVSWTGSRSTTDSPIAAFNPQLSSRLNVTFSQPLLRDFLIDNARAGVETSERRRIITDLNVEATVIATEATVQLAYLNLVAAIEGLNVEERNLGIRETALENARARVRVGAAPEIDIITAEADVETNRESVINAQLSVLQAEDALRTLILDPARADYWTIGLRPTEVITIEERTIDIDAAIQNALANRLDLEVQRRNLEITDLNLRVSRNNTLPNVNLNVNYTAAGTGGTQLQFGAGGFPPPVIGQIDRSFGSALNDSLLGAYPAWTLGVSVGYPLGQTSARANYASAQVARQQQVLALRQAELAIIRDVRDAARQVENAFQRIQVTQSALRSTQQQLDAENRRNQVGLSTTLDLQFRQTQLANATVAELRARIAYVRALILFDRVQRIN